MQPTRPEDNPQGFVNEDRRDFLTNMAVLLTGGYVMGGSAQNRASPNSNATQPNFSANPTTVKEVTSINPDPPLQPHIEDEILRPEILEQMPELEAMYRELIEFKNTYGFSPLINMEEILNDPEHELWATFETLKDQPRYNPSEFRFENPNHPPINLTIIPQQIDPRLPRPTEPEVTLTDGELITAESYATDIVRIMTQFFPRLELIFQENINIPILLGIEAKHAKNLRINPLSSINRDGAAAFATLQKTLIEDYLKFDLSGYTINNDLIRTIRFLNLTPQEFCKLQCSKISILRNFIESLGDRHLRYLGNNGFQEIVGNENSPTWQPKAQELMETGLLEQTEIEVPYVNRFERRTKVLCDIAENLRYQRLDNQTRKIFGEILEAAIFGNPNSQNLHNSTPFDHVFSSTPGNIVPLISVPPYISVRNLETNFDTEPQDELRKRMRKVIGDILDANHFVFDPKVLTDFFKGYGFMDNHTPPPTKMEIVDEWERNI